jgi:modulator of FtsH protease HflK
MEVTASVHYRLSRPDDFLFRQLDGESTVRTATESVLQSVVTTTPLDTLLTTGRQGMEQRVKDLLQQRVDRYAAGVEVLHVKLLDVHPSVEVVDAFREVSGAFEEKNRLINEAEGYRNEQVAVARGNAEARLEMAKGYSVGRVNRADGDAGRFRLFEDAYRTGTGVNDLRLYLETMEEILPGKKKMIIDSSKGHRQLLLLDNGVELSPASPAILTPRPRSLEEQ